MTAPNESVRTAEAFAACRDVLAFRVGELRWDDLSPEDKAALKDALATAERLLSEVTP